MYYLLNKAYIYLSILMIPLVKKIVEISKPIPNVKIPKIKPNDI